MRGWLIEIITDRKMSCGESLSKTSFDLDLPFR